LLLRCIETPLKSLYASHTKILTGSRAADLILVETQPHSLSQPPSASSAPPAV
jgi:hypothetical protein